MEHTIRHGTRIDIPTVEEIGKAVRKEIPSWMTEAVIGCRFTRFSGQATIAGAAFQIGGSATDALGPPPGFLWDVRRLRVTGLNGSDVASVYINDVSPSSLVANTDDIATTTGGGGLFLWDRHVVLSPGDQLLVVGSAPLSSTGTITVSGSVQELPVGLAWRLVG